MELLFVIDLEPRSETIEVYVAEHTLTETSKAAIKAAVERIETY